MLPALLKLPKYILVFPTDKKQRPFVFGQAIHHDADVESALGHAANVNPGALLVVVDETARYKAVTKPVRAPIAVH